MTMIWLTKNSESQPFFPASAAELPRQSELWIPDAGIWLHAKLDLPEPCSARCPLTILVHGITGHSEERHLCAIARTIRETGCAVLRVDLFGHGRSEGSFRVHTVSVWRRNLLAVIDAVCALPFVTELFLSGHSQGGLAVMLAAPERWDRLAGLILLSPAWMIPEDVRGGRLLGQCFDTERLPEEIALHSGAVLERSYLLEAARIDAEAAIDRYPGPVLILQGEADATVPAAYAKKAAERYSRAELVLIPEDTHCYDRNLELVTEAVRAWMKSHINGSMFEMKDNSPAKAERREPAMIKIACIGDSCVDYYDSLDRKYPGGNPVNFAVYLRRMGAEASFVGAVGSDEDGQLVREALQEKHIDISHVQILEGPTSTTHVAMDNGNRVFTAYDPGVMEQFSLREEDLQFIGTHDLAVTALWGHCENDLARIRELGIPVAFDCADLPFDPISLRALPNVDIAFFSDDTADEAALEETVHTLAAMGPKIVVVMRGAIGSMAFDGERFYHQAAIDCRVVDTLGAGDSYIAGFLYALRRGFPIEACMLAGSQNSAITIGYIGAW